MLEAYLMLSGRIRRLKFLAYSILLRVVILLLSLLGIPLVNNARYPFAASILIVILVVLFWMWACAALAVKRLHDLNMPGWHVLWMFVVPSLISGGFSVSINRTPAIGAWGFGVTWTVPVLAMVYLLFARGTDGPNNYGYPP